MDYESCDTYQIKGPDGICIGNDDKYENDEKCEECPAYIRFKRETCCKSK